MMTYIKPFLFGCAIFSLGLLITPRPALADCSVTIDTGFGALEAAFGYAAADGTAQYAVNFTPSCSGTISSITNSMRKIGTPADSAIVGIQNDSSGVPSNSYISSGNPTISTSACGTTQATTMGSPVSVTSGTKYWVVWSRTGSLNSTNRYGLCGADGTGTDGAATAGTDPNNWSGPYTPNIHVYVTFTITSVAATPTSIIGLVWSMWFQ